MADFTGLTVEFRPTTEGSHYEIGVTAGGAWFTFVAFSTPDVEAKLYEASQAASASVAVEPPPPPPPVA